MQIFSREKIQKFLGPLSDTTAKEICIENNNAHGTPPCQCHQRAKGRKPSEKVSQSFHHPPIGVECSDRGVDCTYIVVHARSVK